MAIPGDVGQTDIGKRRIKRHVPSEQLLRRPHQGIADIVADAAQVTEANQLSPAHLCSVAADSLVIGMALRQSQLRPGLEHRPGFAIAACDVGLVSPIVVKEVEFDQFDALHF